MGVLFVWLLGGLCGYGAAWLLNKRKFDTLQQEQADRLRANAAQALTARSPESIEAQIRLMHDEQDGTGLSSKPVEVESAVAVPTDLVIQAQTRVYSGRRLATAAVVEPIAKAPIQSDPKLLTGVLRLWGDNDEEYLVESEDLDQASWENGVRAIEDSR